MVPKGGLQAEREWASHSEAEPITAASPSGGSHGHEAPRRRRHRCRHGRARTRRRLPHGQHHVRHRPPRGTAGRDRGRPRAVRRRRCQTVRLRTSRDLVAGHRRRARHRRRERGHRQLAAPRGRRGPARRRQARPVREADGPVGRGRQGDGRGRGGQQLRGRHRLHLPPVPRDQRHPRAAAGDRRGPPLQRSLLVRLRPGPGSSHQLALPRRPGIGCSRRHRQPPGRPRRVSVRSGLERAGRRHADLHDRASGAAGHDRGARGRRGGRGDRAGGQRGPRDLHRDVRERRGRDLLGLQGGARPRERARLRGVRGEGIGCLRPRPPRSSPSPTSPRPERPMATARS